MKKKIKWVGISGSWRKTNEQVELDVRETVRNILADGNGIVTGGALNVDYFATDEAIQLNPNATHIQVFLPTSLDAYSSHYRKRAKEGVITEKQAEDLISQQVTLKKANPTALIENEENQEVNQTKYFQRNLANINASDKLIAFQVNNREGVQDTVEKAEEKGIPIKLFSYTIE
jgi:predicted Rossmann fold nucleotide-binding protein DprA/Smf involved in DNA uptake